MGNIIFRRGKTDDLPSAAPSGMPLWCTDTETFYIGTGSGVRQINVDEVSKANVANTLEGLIATIPELNYSCGLTGNIQEQLDAKQEAGSYLLTTGTAVKATADAAGNIITSTYEVINKTIITLAASGTIALTTNSINKISPTGTVTFSLPTVNDSTFHQILVQLNMSSVQTINLGTTYYFYKQKPNLSAAGNYDLIYEYDSLTNHWVCGVLSKGAVS